MEFYIFELVWSPNFSLNWQFSVLTKFSQNGYFQSKTEQTIQGLQAFIFCLVNVNSTIVFEHFVDIKNLIILNILKEKLVIFCLPESFYLKIV